MEGLPPLPNPLTPLAWLPPDIASQLEASRYLYSATIGAWLWDGLMSIPEDYMMFRDFKLRMSDIVYVLSRITSFGFVACSLIFQVAEVGDCHKLAMAIGWFGAFALPLNSLLFFFRVRAVFAGHTVLIAIFSILWLGTCTAITAPFAVDGVHIGTTRYCINSDVKSFGSAGIIAGAVNDTLVFVAISLQLTVYSLADSWNSRLKVFFRGQGLGQISKILLQTGQLYYMATVGLNIVAAVVILTPRVPPVTAAMFSIPNVALQNAMACRVYRKLKLGLIKEEPGALFTSRVSGSVRFSSPSSKRSHEPPSTATEIESHISLHDTHDSTKRESLTMPVLVDVEHDVSVLHVSMDAVSPRSVRDGGGWKAGEFA